jgi:hypothetical protein
VQAFAIKTVLEQLSASKARIAKPQECFDRSIVEELKQKGFFQQI